ncbi:MAG: CapA family protein [Dehalococcoidales bacterium]|nr:CapA family protein [Dehalococcoidales bacterium]
MLQEKPQKNLIQVPEFHEADLRIANLENPLSDNQFLADKTVIYAPQNAVDYLKSFNVDGVTIANNHIQDKGEEGILDTIQALKTASISFCGGGENISQARKPMVFSSSNEQIAILGYCDYNRPHLQQIYLAGDDTPGVSPLIYQHIIEDVEKIENDVSRIILFFHWGREHTWFPPSSDIKLARSLLKHPRIDLIIGCHAHLPQGYIEYNGKRAFFSLGNFLFPNLYKNPPYHAVYPENPQNYAITTSSGRVFELTHKRWVKWARRALLISYDTKTNNTNILFTEQDFLKPIVRPIHSFSRLYFFNWVYSREDKLFKVVSDSWFKYITLKRKISLYKLYFINFGPFLFTIKAAMRLFHKLK